jgi:hypothetical protein
MLQQADEEQLEALDGRRKIKGLCETRWSSRADALNIFKSAHALIIDTLDDLWTGGDRNAMQLKLALQDFGFMIALVVTECVLQYSLALSNLLQRPSQVHWQCGRATDSILIVASILLVYQQAHCLCSVAYQLSSVCSVIHSAFRQDLLCPGITLARHCHPV